MKRESKMMDRLVVSEGGLLGVGSHRVALPLDGFKWDGEKEGFTIAKTADELKSMPEWRPANADWAPTQYPVSCRASEPREAEQLCSGHHQPRHTNESDDDTSRAH